jgi:hypothetical protein
MPISSNHGISAQGLVFLKEGLHHYFVESVHSFIGKNTLGIQGQV